MDSLGKFLIDIVESIDWDVFFKGGDGEGGNFKGNCL